MMEWREGGMVMVMVMVSTVRVATGKIMQLMVITINVYDANVNEISRR